MFIGKIIFTGLKAIFIAIDCFELLSIIDKLKKALARYIQKEESLNMMSLKVNTLLGATNKF